MANVWIIFSEKPNTRFITADINIQAVVDDVAIQRYQECLYETMKVRHPDMQVYKPELSKDHGFYLQTLLTMFPMSGCGEPTYYYAKRYKALVLDDCDAFLNKELGGSVQ